SRVLVITHGCWQRRFGSDPSVAGRAVKLKGNPFTVLGVLPETFPGTESLGFPEAYVPLTTSDQVLPIAPGVLEQREAHNFRVMGRLKPGVTLKQAQSELNVVASQLERQYPATNKGVNILVVPETRARPEVPTSGIVYSIASVFMGLTGLVL